MCSWSSNCPGARSLQLPAFAIVGASISQPDKHRLCLPFLHASLLSTVSDGWERFNPSHCKARGCNLVSCRLQDLRWAASWWCFRLQQQAGDRNHYEPMSHDKTGPKLLGTLVGQVVFFFCMPWCRNLSTLIELLFMLMVCTLD